jgi:competence protein ComEC
VNRPAPAATNSTCSVGFQCQPLVVLLLAVSSGIVADRYLAWPLIVWSLLALGGLLVWWLAWRRGRDRGAVMVLLLAAASAGAIRHQAHWRLFSADELGLAAGERSQSICVQAIALSGPRLIPPPPPDVFSSIPSQPRTQVTVRVTRVRDAMQWRAASGRARLSIAGELPDISAGDRLHIFASFRRPSSPRNPGEFDFAIFRRNQRELFELHSRWPQCVRSIGQADGYGGWRWLYRVRRFCQDQLARYVQAPQSDLAAAVLLGARDELSRERAEDFFLTGTIHLLAISGLHIGILACGLWWLLRLLAVPRRGSLIAAAILIVAYAVLTEARPPVIRAAILVVAFCAARLSGRRGSIYNTLALAAVLLLIWNPTVLFQTGPQLSFLAVATIAAFGPLLMLPATEDPVRQLILRSRPWPWRVARVFWERAGQLIMVTTLIWLAAVPLLMHRFHLVSPIALVLNPVIWLPMSVALFAGFAVLTFGGFLSPLAGAAGWICHGSLALLEHGVRWAKQTPWGYFWIPPPATWWVMGFYSLLALMMAVPRDRLRHRWRLTAVVVWLAVGCLTAFPGDSPAHRLTATFVAVGHGACTIVELPDGRTLMFDAGGMGSSTSVVRAISSTLWARGITHLDAVIISHGDLDHYNAIPELIERFTVGSVYVPVGMLDHPNLPLRAFHQRLEERQIPIRQLRAGDRLAAGEDVDIEVWHPVIPDATRSGNADSLVLGIEYSGIRMLLTADIESPGLEDLLAEETSPWHIVTAPHHGGNLPQQIAFAHWARATWVIFSGADPERVQLAEAAYNQRGARSLHVARDGAVQVQIQAGRFQILHWQGFWKEILDDGRFRLVAPPAHSPATDVRYTPGAVGRCDSDCRGLLSIERSIRAFDRSRT